MLMIKTIFRHELAEVSPGMLVRWQTDDRIDPEYGVVTGVVTRANTSYVFVRFFGDNHVKACEPYGLTAG